jgi:C4-dicarboxylate-specific signal transduction histidine kinase
VYLDLWIIDTEGTVISCGRPDSYPDAMGSNVATERWFTAALRTANGNEYAVGDIAKNRSLRDRYVATYAAAVRAGGETQGAVLGVLAIFFDWDTQANAVLNGIRLTDSERARARCLIVDAERRVIAASDGRGLLTETYPLDHKQAKLGHYSQVGKVIGFALTPGYETYQGLGWRAVIELDATA